MLDYIVQAHQIEGVRLGIRANVTLMDLDAKVVASEPHAVTVKIDPVCLGAKLQVPDKVSALATADVEDAGSFKIHHRGKPAGTAIRERVGPSHHLIPGHA